MIFPTGDGQGRMIAEHQPVTLAAMEGLFETAQGAPIAMVGQPDTERLQLDNPLLVPSALSFLTYRRWGAEVKGLKDFPRDQWPDNIPLLYYSYHIMVGLGTLLIALMVLCGLVRCGADALRRDQAVAVGIAVGAAVSLHRHHRRLDDGRTGAPAMADLRHHADRRRRFAARLRRQRIVHADRLHGLVPGARHSVLFLVHREIDHGPAVERGGAR